MLNAGELQQLIFKIMNTDQSLLELNLFIRYCTAFSSAYLFSRRHAGKLSLEYTQADDAKMQQLAIDSIAELFARDEHGSFFKLIQYYMPLIEGIAANPDEAIFMTRRLVVAHTRQSLAKSFSQNDPSGARIYRNLCLVHKRNPEIRLTNYGEKNYLYLQTEEEVLQFPDDLHPEKEEITWDSALNILKNTPGEVETIPSIVKHFFQELNRETNCRHFIDRQQLYRLLKEILGLKLLSIDRDLPAAVNNPVFLSISQSDQKSYTDRIKLYFRQEIQQRFLDKARITRQQAEVYGEILDQYFDDLLMDGFSGKLPEYQAKSAFNDMEAGEWKIHRGRLEYMIKLCKAELQTQYLHEFSNTESVRIENI